MMKQRFVLGTAILFLSMSLTVMVSCTSAATPTSTSSSLTPAILPTLPPPPTESRGIRGTIDKIDDSTLVLITEQGQVTMNIGSDTIIAKTTTGTRLDLREGQSLSVIGNNDANSEISAVFILIRSGVQSPRPPPPAGATPSHDRTPGQFQAADGTITKIDDHILTLDGIVKVKISSDTTILRTTTGTISDLRMGVVLHAMANQDSDGNITATFIHIRPSSQDTSPIPSAGS